MDSLLFAERRNLVSARVPPHFKRSLTFNNSAMCLCCLQLFKNNQRLYKVIKNNNFAVVTSLVLLTYSMEQIPSWEASRFSASQEIPRLLRNPKIYYLIHKFPPPVPIPIHLHPIYTPPTFHSLKIHLNIILHSEINNLTSLFLLKYTVQSISFRTKFLNNRTRAIYWPTH